MSSVCDSFSNVRELDERDNYVAHIFQTTNPVCVLETPIYQNRFDKIFSNPKDEIFFFNLSNADPAAFRGQLIYNGTYVINDHSR